VAFVDTATAQFYISSFEDDIYKTKLETLLVQTKPKEMIIEKGNLSPATLKLIKTNTDVSTLWNVLKPSKEFWDERLTRNYFENEFKSYCKEKMPLKLEDLNELTLSAFGGLVSYLQTLKLDTQLLSLCNIELYNDPLQKAQSLILDGPTLTNLDVLENAGSVKGSLFELLDHCVTPFGKRKFKHWVCHPLRSIEKINERLDAVEAVESSQELHRELKKLPDLERLLSRIHSGTCKIADFLHVIRSFKFLNVGNFFEY
jgi:DNA mismatch repair protein MSH6